MVEVARTANFVVAKGLFHNKSWWNWIKLGTESYKFIYWPFYLKWFGEFDGKTVAVTKQSAKIRATLVQN